jgi:hypothetical protein
MPGNDGEAIAGDIDDIDDIGRTDGSAAQAAGLIQACYWPEPDESPVAFRDIEVGRDSQLDPLGREAPQGDQVATDATRPFCAASWIPFGPP